MLNPAEAVVEVMPHIDNHHGTQDGHEVVYKVKNEHVLNRNNEANTVLDVAEMIEVVDKRSHIPPKIPGVDILDVVPEENSGINTGLQGQTNAVSTNRTTISEDLGLVMENENRNNGHYNLWGNHGCNYEHCYDANTFCLEGDDSGVVLTMKDELPIETPQMSMNKGLRLFGEGSEMAVKKEMQQLHD